MLETVLASSAEEETAKEIAGEQTISAVSDKHLEGIKAAEHKEEGKRAAGKNTRKRKEEGNVSDTERDEKPAQDTAC